MAMPLAAMNPVMGISSKAGSYLVNVTNHDKDLTSDFTGVASSLDMDDNLYGLDNMGRFYSKHKYDIMKKDDIVEAWEIKTDNVQALMEQVIKEASLPEERRPVHKESIYEFFTGKRLLDESQYDMDPLLEKVELKKMSAALNGNLSSTRQGFLQAKDRDEQSGAYTPDNDNLQYSTGVLLASQDMRLLKEVKDTKVDPNILLSEGFLDAIKDKFKKLTAPPFNATPAMGILWRIGPKGGKAWPHFAHPVFKDALLDSLICYNDNFRVRTKFHLPDPINLDRNWYEKHKKDVYRVITYTTGKPLRANTVYHKSFIPNVGPANCLGTGVWFYEYTLEDLFKYSNVKYQLVDKNQKSTQEASENDTSVESITPIEESIKSITEVFQNQADKLNLEMTLLEASKSWKGLWRNLNPNKVGHVLDNIKSFMYPQALKEKYKGPNLYISLPEHGKDRYFRIRCEMIVINDKGEVLVDRGRSFRRAELSYDFPGGGLEKGETVLESAIRETEEEARVIVQNPLDTGIYYAYEVPEDSKINYGFWGVANFICVGNYSKKYTGYIKKDDRDSFVTRMEWIKPEDLKDLTPAHKKAIDVFQHSIR